MVWNTFDVMFSKEMEERNKVVAINEEGHLKSSIFVPKESINSLIKEINSVLVSLDREFKIEYGRFPKNLEEIVIGVGPFGGLGMLVEDFFSSGDTLYMPLDSNDILYVKSGETKFAKVGHRQFIGYELSSLDRSGRGLFRNNALVIKDGYITVYKNGLMSDIWFKVSLKTGKVV
jgi:hypothetical protein